MNKTFMLLGMITIGMVHAQTGKVGSDHAQHNTAVKRVGINTEKPAASLEIKKLSNKPSVEQVEGLLLPHLSQTERNAMTKEALVNGLMIFNTDKNCIDWWNGSHWQCTDGSQKDEHGDAYKKTYTATATYNNNGAGKSFTKADCPAGQNGSSVTYTETAKGNASSTVSMQDAQTKALADAKAKFEEAGQAYANANGTCTPATPPTTPITMPAGITISNSQYWVASIYDTDYLPFSAPTERASWTKTAPIAADGRADKTIDVQGRIPAAGVTVQIPVTATGSGKLPAYSTSVSIPAERTQDNQARILTLSWQAQPFTSETKMITAKLIPNNSVDLNIKKLDLKGGLGNDYKGLELATFKIPKSSTDGATPTNYTGIYEVRAISGIPDKKFGVETNGVLEHQFIYLPELAPNGYLILNHNLGAEYTRVDSQYFNPTIKNVFSHQYEDINTDWKQVGSLFQWGRDSDGHELINPNYPHKKNEIKMKYEATQDSWKLGRNPHFFRGQYLYSSWVKEMLPPVYWSRYDEEAEVNPCPSGWSPLNYEFFKSVTAGLTPDRYDEGKEHYRRYALSDSQKEKLNKEYPYLFNPVHRESCCRGKNDTAHQDEHAPAVIGQRLGFVRANGYILMIGKDKEDSVDFSDGHAIRCMRNVTNLR